MTNNAFYNFQCSNYATTQNYVDKTKTDQLKNAIMVTTQRLYNQKRPFFNPNTSDINFSYTNKCRSSIRADNPLLSNIGIPVFISKYDDVSHKVSLISKESTISTHYTIFAETVKKKPLFCSYKNKNSTEKSTPSISRHLFGKPSFKRVGKDNKLSHSVAEHRNSSRVGRENWPTRGHTYGVGIDTELNDSKVNDMIKNAQLLIIKDSNNGRFFLKNKEEKGIIIGMDQRNLNIRKIELKPKEKKKDVALSFSNSLDRKHESLLPNKSLSLTPKKRRRKCVSSQGNNLSSPSRSSKAMKFMPLINKHELETMYKIKSNESSETKTILKNYVSLKNSANELTKKCLFSNLRSKPIISKCINKSMAKVSSHSKDIRTNKLDSLHPREEYTLPHKKPPLPKFSFLSKARKITHQEIIPVEKPKLKPRPPQVSQAEESYLVN